VGTRRILSLPRATTLGAAPIVAAARTGFSSVSVVGNALQMRRALA